MEETSHYLTPPLNSVKTSCLPQTHRRKQTKTMPVCQTNSEDQIGQHVSHSSTYLRENQTMISSSPCLMSFKWSLIR